MRGATMIAEDAGAFDIVVNIVLPGVVVGTRKVELAENDPMPLSPSPALIFALLDSLFLIEESEPFVLYNDFLELAVCVESIFDSSFGSKLLILLDGMKYK